MGDSDGDELCESYKEMGSRAEDRQKEHTSELFAAAMNYVGGGRLGIRHGESKGIRRQVRRSPPR